MMLLQQAQEKMATQPMADLRVETVGLRQARGRVLAQDVIAQIDIPPADNSAMDGFAICASDLKDASILTEFELSQRVTAGANPVPLKPGTVARIFTGAIIPPGADTVIIQEHCSFDSARVGDSVRFTKRVEKGANIRPRGQDIRSGSTILNVGKKLNAIDLSLLASIGCATIDVFEPLTVAVFSTGDELVEPGQPLLPGQIYNSNRPLLLELCHELGFKTVDCGIVADTLDATKQALIDLAGQVDLILSSGGVSVGEEDHIKPAVEATGALDMWKVQIKPGKPVAFGNVQGTPFLGLPGNPVSSFVVFQLLAVPLMRALQGTKQRMPADYQVKAGFDKPLTSREEYIRVKLHTDGNGELVAERFNNLSSGVMSSLSWADGLVRHEIGAEISKGSSVSFLPLNQAML